MLLQCYKINMEINGMLSPCSIYFPVVNNVSPSNAWSLQTALAVHLVSSIIDSIIQLMCNWEFAVEIIKLWNVFPSFIGHIHCFHWINIFWLYVFQAISTNLKSYNDITILCTSFTVSYNAKLFSNYNTVLKWNITVYEQTKCKPLKAQTKMY